MKGKIKLVVSFLIVFISNNLIAQKGDHMEKCIGMFSEYIVINTQILEALDSLTVYIQECPYFILDRPYHFCITIQDTTTIWIESLPCSHTIIERIFTNVESNQKGFFYYKNKLVLVNDQIGIIKLFFKKTDLIKPIYYQMDYNIYNQIVVGQNKMSTVYKYENDRLEEVKEYRSYCSDRFTYFMYTVKKNDTWDSLAEKCGCPIEELKYVNGRYEETLPKEDYLIIVHYEIVNNKLVSIRREQ